jgi:hypothetical protein
VDDDGSTGGVAATGVDDEAVAVARPAIAQRLTLSATGS